MALALSTLLIVALVVPWSSLQDHAHWASVRWIPLVPPLTPLDTLLNVLLYVPFGAAFAARSRSWKTILPAALVLSLLTECTQVYSHGRIPSMTDVLANGTGALLGAAMFARLRTPGKAPEESPHSRRVPR